MIEQMLRDLAEIFRASQISPAAGVALIPAFYKLYPEELNKLIEENCNVSPSNLIQRPTH